MTDSIESPDGMTVRRFGLFAALFTLSLFGPHPLSSSGKERRIEVLLSSDTGIYAEALAGIQSSIDGEVRITYLDSLGEDSGVESYFRERDTAGTDAFVVLGMRAAKAALDNVQKKPVIFSMITSPRTLDFKSDRACGVALDVSIAEYFRTLREIAPQARRVTAFYTTAEGEYQAAEGDYFDLRFGYQYKRLRLRSKEDFSSALQNLKGKTDAFYLIADPLYDSERFEQLSRFCRENGIVLMTGFASLVRAGTTFGIAPDYGKIGVMTAGMANRVASGQSDCRKEGTMFPEQTFLSLNLTYAKASGLAIPQPVVERARLTELLQAGVNLWNDGKLRSAKIVFETILRRDPANQTALFYRDLITQRTTGTEVRPLLLQARRFRESGNLEAAAGIYRQVMRVYPGQREASEGLETCLTSLSESAREDGERLAQSGSFLEAIRRYAASLNYSEKNDRARADLEQLRRTQQPHLQEYFRTGVQHYQQREYDLAVHSFENVLLIDPRNQQAQEYLRIASKKKEAVDRLIKNP
ncbi:MAG: peptide ABC transporter substrate-binding protein [Spirochaetia bacterium]|nr:peptide ABC transporter substrate-binding protein [Spirochaetia bacterium]